MWMAEEDGPPSRLGFVYVAGSKAVALRSSE